MDGIYVSGMFLGYWWENVDFSNFKNTKGEWNKSKDLFDYGKGLPLKTFYWENILSFRYIFFHWLSTAFAVILK